MCMRVGVFLVVVGEKKIKNQESEEEEEEEEGKGGLGNTFSCKKETDAAVAPAGQRCGFMGDSWVIHGRGVGEEWVCTTLLIRPSCAAMVLVVTVVCVVAVVIVVCVVVWHRNSSALSSFWEIRAGWVGSPPQWMQPDSGLKLAPPSIKHR